MDLLTQSLVLATLLLFLVVGFFYKKRPTTTKEYALGNADIKTSTLTATMIATSIGGGWLIGYSSALYKEGMWLLLAFFVIPIKYCLTSLLIVPKLSKYYGCFSVAEVMERMYGKYTRILIGITAFMLCIGILGVQAKALLWVMEHVFKQNALLVTIIAMSIIILYSSIGGVSSVIKTDVIQWAIFMLIIPLIAYHLIDISNGITFIIENLPANKSSLLPKEGILGLFSFMLIYLLPSTVPYTIHRILIGRDCSKNQTSIYALAFVSLLNLIFISCVAFIAVTKFPNIAPKETIFTIVQDVINNRWITAFFAISLIAVIASTADSIINTSSIILVSDVLPKKITETQKIKLLQITTIFASITAIIITFVFSSVLDIVLFFGQYYSIIVAVPLLVGLFLKELRKETFWISACIGAISLSMLHLTYPNLGHTKFLISFTLSLCGYFITFFVVTQNKFLKWNFSSEKMLNAIKIEIPIKMEVLGYIIVAFYLLAIFFKEHDLNRIITLDSSLLSGFLGFSLFFTDVIKPKYKNIFILSVIWYCLAFFPAYFFLIQPIKIFMITNLVASIIMLTWLFNRQMFISFLLSGNIIAIIIFFICKSNLGISIIAQIMHLLLFVSCVGAVAYILGRKTDNINEAGITRRTLQGFAKSITANLKYQDLYKTTSSREIDFEEFKHNTHDYFYRLLVQRNIKLKFGSSQPKLHLTFSSGNFYKVTYSIIFNVLYCIQNDEIAIRFYDNQDSKLERMEVHTDNDQIKAMLQQLRSKNIGSYREVLRWHEIHTVLNTLRIKLKNTHGKLIIYFPSHVMKK